MIQDLCSSIASVITYVRGTKGKLSFLIIVSRDYISRLFYMYVQRNTVYRLYSCKITHTTPLGSSHWKYSLGISIHRPS